MASHPETNQAPWRQRNNRRGCHCLKFLAARSIELGNGLDLNVAGRRAVIDGAQHDAKMVELTQREREGEERQHEHRQHHHQVELHLLERVNLIEGDAAQRMHDIGQLSENGENRQHQQRRGGGQKKLTEPIRLPERIASNGVSRRVALATQRRRCRLMITRKRRPRPSRSSTTPLL